MKDSDTVILIFLLKHSARRTAMDALSKTMYENTIIINILNGGTFGCTIKSGGASKETHPSAYKIPHIFGSTPDAMLMSPIIRALSQKKNTKTSNHITIPAPPPETVAYISSINNMSNTPHCGRNNK